ncbi:hypothetical protein HanHA89_Chr14g0572001 [Helianthus annuus]|nr:hypothetical protein HanHA89_Chr14g0572001 [Helianthus annuus]
MFSIFSVVFDFTPVLIFLVILWRSVFYKILWYFLSFDLFTFVLMYFMFIFVLMYFFFSNNDDFLPLFKNRKIFLTPKARFQLCCTLKLVLHG